MSRIVLSLKWWLITLLCWPLLLWQGKKVRKMALRLPEAAGSRSGVSGDTQHMPLRLLILGDSAAAGVGVAQQHDALCGQLVGVLAQRFRVSWQLEAKTGLDSSGLISCLSALHGQCFDVVILSVGVNDVTSQCSRRRFRQQLSHCLALLQRQNGNPLVLFSAIPPMQHFRALPAPLNVWLGIKAALLNSSAAMLLQQHKTVFVTTADNLTGAMLCEDGFHPSAEGYRVWATHLAKAVDDNIMLLHTFTTFQSRT